MLQADDRLTTDSHTSDTTDARIMTIPAQLHDAVTKIQIGCNTLHDSVAVITQTTISPNLFQLPKIRLIGAIPNQ